MRRVPSIGASVQLPQNVLVNARLNQLAGQLLATGRQQRLNAIVDEVV
jgi:hypothetical protein